MSSSSVVGVNVTKIRKQRTNPFLDPFWDDFFPQTRAYKVESFGSGVIYSKDGYIITNEHVIKNASEIFITTNDGKKHKAELIGVDELTDIALLKIVADNLDYITLGDSDDLIIGEWVVALGNPLGLFTLSNHVSATAGIISAMNMNFGRKESGRVYQNMIQTDASINPGNSGGPLINSLGEAIGINTFIMTNSNYNEGSIGIGFAIPINLVKEIIDIIINDGEVNRNYFTGIHIQDIDNSIKKYLNLNSINGVIITEIEPNSSGSRSGLIVGDVILEVDGRKVKDSSDIFKIIDEGLRKTGDDIILTVLRDSIGMKISLKLEGKKSTWWRF
jgi:serine protease Do